MGYIKRLFLIIVIYTSIFAGNANAGLLGSFEKKNDDISQFPKWVNMLEKYHHEEISGFNYCGNNTVNGCKINEWKQFINTQKNTDDKLELLKAVNRYINEFRYIRDETQWKQNDHWDTVNQFLTKGGDCEDFAIAKFITLRKLGFSNDDMRILVLQNSLLQMQHAVLVVYINKKAYFLDNKIPKIATEDDYKRYYIPVYSINETNWWNYKS